MYEFNPNWEIAVICMILAFVTTLGADSVIVKKSGTADGSYTKFGHVPYFDFVVSWIRMIMLYPASYYLTVHYGYTSPISVLNIHTLSLFQVVIIEVLIAGVVLDKLYGWLLEGCTNFNRAKNSPGANNNTMFFTRVASVELTVVLGVIICSVDSTHIINYYLSAFSFLHSWIASGMVILPTAGVFENTLIIIVNMPMMYSLCVLILILVIMILDKNDHGVKNAPIIRQKFLMISVLSVYYAVALITFSLGLAASLLTIKGGYMHGLFLIGYAGQTAILYLFHHMLLDLAHANYSKSS